MFASTFFMFAVTFLYLQRLLTTFLVFEVSLASHRTTLSSCAATKMRSRRKQLLLLHSNHLPSILRQLSVSINKRISTLSSDIQVFDDAVQTYQNALGHSNFNHKLEWVHATCNTATTQEQTTQHNLV